MSDQPPDGLGDDAQVSKASAPPDWLIRTVNPVLERLLRSRLHWLVSDSLLLLSVTGRRSGTEYRFPVGYERRGDAVYVTSYDTNWWRNLRGGGERVTVWLRGTRRTGHAEVVEDDAAVAEYLHGYLRRHGVDAARRAGLDVAGDAVPDESALRDAVGHVVVVRIELHERAERADV